MNTNQRTIDITTEFCGIKLVNPFILASAPPTDTYEKMRKAFELGWAGAVIKTVKPDKLQVKNASPRFATIKGQKGDVVGFENFELVSTENLSYWIETIKKLKREFPDRIIIGSIMAEVNKKDWQDLTQVIESAGVDAIELNFSCPHGMPEKKMGAAIGQDKEVTKEITSWVKEVAKTPVIVKLSPNVTDIVEIGKAALEAGADALAAINTVQCLTGVDIHTFEPMPSVQKYSTFGGYSGQAVKPIGLRVVSQLAQNLDTPISGMGGISNWENAVEYMLVGANHVQVCTEVMLKGFGIIKPMLKGLTDYMIEKDFQSLGDVQGKTLKYLTSHEALDKEKWMHVHVNTEKCIGCGKCVISCEDSGKNALFINIEKKAETWSKKCDGCSLCTHVCPTNALEIR